MQKQQEQLTRLQSELDSERRRILALLVVKLFSGYIAAITHFYVNFSEVLIFNIHKGI